MAMPERPPVCRREFAVDLVVLFGEAIIVLAGVKLLVVLIVDTVTVLRQAIPGNKVTAQSLGFGEILDKLPERYLTSIISFLFGLLLANPAAFAALWGKASGA
jgi:hypothetical protein